MITLLKRTAIALAVVVPATALVAAPVMATTPAKAKHHVSIHKASHKTHAKKSVAPTAS